MKELRNEVSNQTVCELSSDQMGAWNTTVHTKIHNPISFSQNISEDIL